MARYVDGFVLPVPKKNVAAHRDRVNAKVISCRPLTAPLTSRSVPENCKASRVGPFGTARAIKA